MTEAEQFLVRTTGGPFHDETRVTSANDNEWPLPDELPVREHGGRYVKVSESDLAPQEPGSHVLRGAEYEWRQDPEPAAGPPGLDPQAQAQRDALDGMVREAGLAVEMMIAEEGARLDALPRVARDAVVMQATVGYLLGAGLVAAVPQPDGEVWPMIGWPDSIPAHLRPDIDEAVARHERMLAQLGTHVAQP